MAANKLQDSYNIVRYTSSFTRIHTRGTSWHIDDLLTVTHANCGNLRLIQQSRCYEYSDVRLWCRCKPFEYAADNLANVSQNTSASRSRILDADYASETTELARTQIIQQAGTAMLSQANQQAQSVLALLK